MHALTKWQSFIMHKLLFSLANTHAVLQTTSPPSILFSHTLTTTRQSHHIKQKPVTAHISGRLGSVWTHSWERIGFHMRPVSLCFCFQRLGFALHPLLWAVGGNLFPRRCQWGNIEPNETQHGPVCKAFSIQVTFLMSEMKRDGKTKDALILKFWPISIRQ